MAASNHKHKNVPPQTSQSLLALPEKPDPMPPAMIQSLLAQVRGSISHDKRVHKTPSARLQDKHEDGQRHTSDDRHPQTGSQPSGKDRHHHPLTPIERYIRERIRAKSSQLQKISVKQPHPTSEPGSSRNIPGTQPHLGAAYHEDVPGPSQIFNTFKEHGQASHSHSLSLRPAGQTRKSLPLEASLGLPSSAPNQESQSTVLGVKSPSTAQKIADRVRSKNMKKGPVQDFSTEKPVTMGKRPADELHLRNPVSGKPNLGKRRKMKWLHEIDDTSYVPPTKSASQTPPSLAAPQRNLPMLPPPPQAIRAAVPHTSSEGRREDPKPNQDHIPKPPARKVIYPIPAHGLSLFNPAPNIQASPNKQDSIAKVQKSSLSVSDATASPHSSSTTHQLQQAMGIETDAELSSHSPRDRHTASPRDPHKGEEPARGL